MKCPTMLMSAAAVVLVMVVIGRAGSGEALAQECGDVLTVDTTLDDDLECEGSALVIGADGITVDLNGHTLRSIYGDSFGVDNSGGFDDVTIRGGTIDGFKEAIHAEGADRLTMTGLTIPGVSGEDLIPGFGIFGAINVQKSDTVVVEDSSISVETVPNGPDAILFWEVDNVRVENVDIDGGLIGVDLASCGPNDCPEPFGDQAPTNGVVRGCTIRNNTFGVMAFNSTDTTIEGNVIEGAAQEGIRIGYCCIPLSGIKVRSNEISGCGRGLRALSLAEPAAYPQLPISGLVIEDNHVHDNAAGFSLVNVQGSMISNNLIESNGPYGLALLTAASGNTVCGNTITGHSGRFGIGALVNFNDPPLPGPDGNLICRNTVNGNSPFDLFQAATAGPNTWEENCFEETNGADDITESLCPVDPVFRRGDTNGDGVLNVTDPIYTLSYLFDGGGEVACLDAADADDNGRVEITDGVFSLNWLFLDGPEPSTPGARTCGPDGTDDDLPGCDYDSTDC